MRSVNIRRVLQSCSLILTVAATLLLASKNAGSFITGIEMIVDGGFSAMSI